MAVADLAQAVVDAVTASRQIQRAARELHGHAGAAERARDEWQRVAVVAILRQHAAEDFA